MPAPVLPPPNKYRQQMDNNFYLLTKMQEAFIYAYDSLTNQPLGSVDTFSVEIDGILFDFTSGQEIFVNGLSYVSCSTTVRKQAYDRLEKFMQIAIQRYNTQYNL